MLRVFEQLKMFENRRVWTLLLVFVDIFAALSAAVLSLIFRQSEIIRALADNITLSIEYIYALVFSVLLLVIVYAANGLYTAKNIHKVREIILLSKAHMQLVVMLMAAAYLYQYDFSRFIFFVFVCLSFILIIFGRFVAYTLKQWLLCGQIGVHNIVIIGKGKLAKDLERSLSEYYGKGMRIVCNMIPELSSGSVTIPIQSLREVVQKYSFVTVYVADPQLSHEYILELMSGFSESHVQFKIVADIFYLATGSFNVTNIDEIPTLDLGKVTPRWWYRVLKRVLDIGGSLFLIILTAPLWLLIGALIKIDTNGPIFIFQKRIGYKGKPFIIWKFRTMHSDVPLYGQSPKKQDDTRITRVGALLRKTSLDELPQLVNILRGDMSLVGPRPEMPFIVEGYTSWQKKRLEAKPGLTGLWQILGRKDLPLVENLQYDFYYINNQSLIFDFVILLKTIPVVLFGRGAY